MSCHWALLTFCQHNFSFVLIGCHPPWNDQHILSFIMMEIQYFKSFKHETLISRGEHRFGRFGFACFSANRNRSELTLNRMELDLKPNFNQTEKSVRFGPVGSARGVISFKIAVHYELTTDPSRFFYFCFWSNRTELLFERNQISWFGLKNWSILGWTRISLTPSQKA